MEIKNDYTWQISRIAPEAPSVFSLYLEPQFERPSFKAGQYLTVKIPGLKPTEGRAYSISSAPHEEIVRITVRKIGLFSTALTELSVGSIINTSRPYGYFYPETNDDSRLAFIIGGIGITPCISILKHLTYTESHRPMQLLYSNQTEADIVFKDELTALERGNSIFSTHYFITREKPKTDGLFTGRMTPTNIFTIIPDAMTTEFFLCGSIDFTRSLWRELRDVGVPQHQLYTEGFF